MDFCKAFNAKMAKDDGLIIPVVGQSTTALHVHHCPPAVLISGRWDRQGQRRAQQDQGGDHQHEAGRGDAS